MEHPDEVGGVTARTSRSAVGVVDELGGDLGGGDADDSDEPEVSGFAAGTRPALPSRRGAPPEETVLVEARKLRTIRAERRSWA